LIQWVESEIRTWKIIWLYGPAGTGKSAVAQTFAEHCAGLGRLGAAFFFSRANGRNDPKTVAPTIAYQLGLACVEYKIIIAELIANDPLVLKKFPRAQFTDLIAGPFLRLKRSGHRVTQKPLVIILDGLDECAGMDEQCEFVEMIREAMTRKDLPLLWLIVSRPEPHLTYMFTRADFPVTSTSSASTLTLAEMSGATYVIGSMTLARSILVLQRGRGLRRTTSTGLLRLPMVFSLLRLLC
jgi:hypothetical protein